MRKTGLNLNEASFRELIQEAVAQINNGRFDPIVILNNLGRFESVPNDISDEEIEQLYYIIYECIPVEDYDFGNTQAKQNHLLSILMLLKFMKDPTVISLFNPSQEEITRMKLSKMIKEGDSQMYATGL